MKKDSFWLWLIKSLRGKNKEFTEGLWLIAVVLSAIGFLFSCALFVINILKGNIFMVFIFSGGIILLVLIFFRGVYALELA